MSTNSANQNKKKKRKNRKRNRFLRLLFFLLVIMFALVGWLIYDAMQNRNQVDQPMNSEAQTESQQAFEEPETENVAIPIEIETETEEETEEYIPEEKEVTISLAGDCSLGRLQIHGYDGTFWAYYDSYGKDYFFKNVQEYFANDSMTLVNFEGVLTDSDNRVEKTYNIKGRPEFVDVLPAASIECVTFGNNHRIDYGEQGVTDTIACFDQENITWAYDDNLGLYETEEGIKIGYVSVSAFGNETSENYLKDGIETLKADGADFVIAACHWGIEGEHYPYDYQQGLGKKLIDWGADLVVGCHPHVLQGFEYYNGHYIIYSLGNFCFGGNRNPTDKNTMIVQVKLHYTDGVQDAEPMLTAIPCRLSGHDGYNDYSPVIAEGSTKDTILSLLNDYSNRYGVQIGENGQLSPIISEENE